MGGLSLTWQSLSVRGGRTPGQAKVFAHDLGSLAVSPFTSAYEAIRGKVRSNYPESSAHQSPEDGLHDGKSQKYLLRDLNGTLKPGEMMLVLVCQQRHDHMLYKPRLRYITGTSGGRNYNLSQGCSWAYFRVFGSRWSSLLRQPSWQEGAEELARYERDSPSKYTRPTV